MPKDAIFVLVQKVGELVFMLQHELCTRDLAELETNVQLASVHFTYTQGIHVVNNNRVFTTSGSERLTKFHNEKTFSHRVLQ
jgi:hypothetical protein